MNEVFDKVIGLCYTGNNYGKLVKTLDKEEFRIKLEEINKLVQNKDYKVKGKLAKYPGALTEV